MYLVFLIVLVFLLTGIEIRIRGMSQHATLVVKSINQKALFVHATNRAFC